MNDTIALPVAPQRDSSDQRLQAAIERLSIDDLTSVISAIHVVQLQRSYVHVLERPSLHDEFNDLPRIRVEIVRGLAVITHAIVGAKPVEPSVGDVVFEYFDGTAVIVVGQLAGLWCVWNSADGFKLVSSDSVRCFFRRATEKELAEMQAAMDSEPTEDARGRALQPGDRVVEFEADLVGRIVDVLGPLVSYRIEIDKEKRAEGTVEACYAGQLTKLDVEQNGGGQ